MQVDLYKCRKNSWLWLLLLCDVDWIFYNFYVICCYAFILSLSKLFRCLQ